MKIVLYGAEPEWQWLEGFLSGHAGYCYRNVAVEGFSDYDRLIAALGSGPPALVIVTMDGAAGMEGVIAAKNLLPEVPVIWFSDDNGFGVQSYRLGCAYFHEKPISSEVLLAAIAKCV